MQAEWIEKLSCYLDGELDAQARAEVESAIESDPELQKLFEHMTRVDASIRPAYATTFHQDPPAKLTDLLQSKTTSGLSASGWLRRWLPAPLLATASIALASGLALGAGVTTLTANTGLYSIAENGHLVPGKSLRTILASAPSGEAFQVGGIPVQVQLSIATAEGYCRQVQTGNLASLLCTTDGETWSVDIATHATPSGQPANTYAMASGEAPDAIVNAIGNLEGVTILDPLGEESAIDAGWKL